MTDFKAIAASLEERGFCVIPEFMSRDEIDFLVENPPSCPIRCKPRLFPPNEKQACGAAPWR